MATLSEDLKQARELRGLSLADLASKTRISRTSLEALERGDYGQLPGEVFAVGFIRTYAREVGMDDEEAVHRYKEETGQLSKPQQPVSDKIAGGAAGLPPREEKPAAPKRTYLWVLAVLLVLALALYYMRGVNKTPPPPPPAEKSVAREPVSPLPPAPEPAVTPSPAQNITTVNPPEEAPAEETVKETVKEPEKPEQVRLEVHVTAPSWFAYEADEKPYVILGILQPGRVVVIEAREYILIDSGNAGGIEITYNGKPLGPLGPSGAVRKDIMYTAHEAGVKGQPRVSRPILRQLTSIETPVTTGG